MTAICGGSIQADNDAWLTRLQHHVEAARASITPVPRTSRLTFRYNSAMSQIDELIEAGKAIPPSHQTTPQDLCYVVSALVAREQYGDTFMRAAQEGPEAVADLFGRDPDEIEDEPVAEEPFATDALPESPVPTSPEAPTGLVGAVDQDDAAQGERAPLSPEEIQQFQQLQARMSASQPPQITSE